MKKFAFFLPQFHEIPENNEWWGDGFTEWVNVKNAKPLYRGHLQPKEPKNENYYNLLNKETVRWQTELMEQYGIDGLIYYHYYFSGKKLLEQPAENLLKWTDIEQKFFFCWANHTWCRSWNGSKEVLLEQTYGHQKEWNEHFSYLLPFFKDARYEKRNNKPVFMIYDSAFSERKEMFKFFDQKCKENGFDGICIIETYSARNWPNDFEELIKNKSDETQFLFLREPALSQFMYDKSLKYSPKRILNKVKRILAQKGCTSCVKKYKGNELFELQEKNYEYSENVVHGLFFEWDNTPRHKQRGYIIEPVDKAHFMSYMDKVKNEEYVFINAWNEWAEGMMLEPTVENGYKYLEWISEWSINNENILK